MRKWTVQFDFALTVKDVMSMPNKVELDSEAEELADERLSDPRYVKRLARKVAAFLRDTPPDELAAYFECWFAEPNETEE